MFEKLAKELLKNSKDILSGFSTIIIYDLKTLKRLQGLLPQSKIRLVNLLTLFHQDFQEHK
jgi:hypothetical protein